MPTDRAALLMKCGAFFASPQELQCSCCVFASSSCEYECTRTMTCGQFCASILAFFNIRARASRPVRKSSIFGDFGHIVTRIETFGRERRAHHHERARPHRHQPSARPLPTASTTVACSLQLLCVCCKLSHLVGSNYYLRTN